MPVASDPMELPYDSEDQQVIAALRAESRWIEQQVAKSVAPPKQKPNKFSDLVSAIDALHNAVSAEAPKNHDALELPDTGSSLTKNAFAAGFTDQREYERALALGYKTRAEYWPALYRAQIAARHKAREAIKDGTART